MKTATGGRRGMDDLALLQSWFDGAAMIGLLAFLRIGTAAALLPAFGERSIPPRLRLMLALAFTLITAPVVADELTRALALPGAFPMLWLTEPAVGLALGISLRLTVMALQMAGTMIAQSTSLAQAFSSAGSEPSTVVGEMLTLGGLALAVTLGLHVQLAATLAESYRIFAPGSFPPAGELLGWGVSRVAASFALAFTLALPFVIAALIYNVALGIINRAMPQLMVLLVGAPALTAGGLILLALVAPQLIELWLRQMAATLANPF